MVIVGNIAWVGGRVIVTVQAGEGGCVEGVVKNVVVLHTIIGPQIKFSVD